MTAYWTQAEHASDYDDWINELLENAPESYDGDEAAESIVTRYVRDLEERPEIKRREHRAYDTQEVRGAPDGFRCGWCGGWGHKADSRGAPATCHECNGLGWYRGE